MSETPTWVDVRDKAVERYAGQTPRAADEEAVVAIFETHPAMVIRQVGVVAGLLEAGSIRWAWSVLRKRVEADATAIRDVRPKDRDREQAVARAERYMRLVGWGLPSEAYVIEELFDSQGILRDYATSADLRKQMVALWHELRPLAEQVEREAAERAQRWIAQRDRTEAAKHDEPAPLEPANPFLGAGE